MRSFCLVVWLLVALLPTSSVARPSETLDWLRGYLRIDTSNPPGREVAAVTFLAAILHSEGVTTHTYFSEQNRPNLLARLEGRDRSLGALVLLHHIDVVPAGERWTRKPFGGQIADGHVWGRGAIDAKSLGIAHLAAFLSLRRERIQPVREVIFLATADEEAGGGEGVRFLLEQRRDELGAIAGVLTEGGANQVLQDRLIWWGLESSQKRALWLRVSSKGRAGHGSSYNPASASHQLIAALDRVLALPRPMRISADGHRFFRSIAPMYGPGFSKVFDQPTVAATQKALDEAAAQGRLHEARVPNLALLKDTIQVTTFDNGNRAPNAVSPLASATLDIRLLPDTDQDLFLRTLTEALGEGIEVEILLESPIPSSVPDPWLFGSLKRALSPRAPVMSAMISGTTDARTFRTAGIPAYGFSPFLLTSAEYRGVHGPDESISIEKFEAGVRLMTQVVSQILSDRAPARNHEQSR